MSRILCVCFLLAVPGAAAAQQEPLVKKVKTSIAKGVDSLVSQQRPDGSWEDLKDPKNAPQYQGGPTGLAILALLNCDGVIDNPKKDKERKDAIAKGFVNLRKIDSPKVYVRALQTMALAEAKTDVPLIKANVQWLLDARVYKNGRFIGWTYDKRATNQSTDASNSQYAMLALWYARQAGVPIDRKVWVEIQDYYARTQNADGSWTYGEYGPDDEVGPSMTMTVAGLCGLLIAGQELASQDHKCGFYDDNNAVAKAQQWLSKRFGIDLQRLRAYYHLYGLERAGRLSGNRFFGEHDWYREGCEFLVTKQGASGVWPSRGDGWDRWPHINTSFALLFLSKGRTPVLMSKLVHGNFFPAREKDNDWNNDRNDLRHLTDYLSRTDLFEKKTATWQTYDIRRSIEAILDKNVAPNAEEEAAIVADMRQSPILYITGHKSLLPGRLGDNEVRFIKRFVETGGFILAEACCGDPNFDAGFKQWVKNNWDDELKYIDSTHPVWTCFNQVQPGQFKLMELKAGCRTVILYSPQDLSCQWESNQHDGAARPAFLLGANIVAFATGKTPPLPRLTQIDVASANNEPKEPRKRGYFQVRQLRTSAEWPAEKAMTNLLTHVQKTTALDVMPRVEKIGFGGFDSTIRSSKFLYMHGRGEFKVDPNNLEPLRFTLENGGLLFADACCGDKAYDKSFRKFAQDLFPKEKLVRVPADAANRDRLFGAFLNNGEELNAKTIQCRVKAGEKPLPMEPYLEGIQLNGRWVVLYSPYDIGCALERGTSSDCVGYDTESALKIATAAVRYNTRP